MEKNKNSGSLLAKRMAVSLVCGLAAGFAFMIDVYKRQPQIYRKAYNPRCKPMHRTNIVCPEKGPDTKALYL